MIVCCAGFVQYMNFRRQLYAVFTLSCIVCLLLAYLNSLVSKTERTASLNFAKLPHHESHRIRKLVSRDGSKKSRYLSMDDLDKITIKKKANVTVHELPLCANLTFRSSDPEELQETFRWQKIEDDNPDGYVFSAYYDQRFEPHIVRIVAIIKDIELKRYCHLWFNVTLPPVIIEAALVLLPEAHEKRYTAVFYVCYIPPQTLEIPYAVSIVNSPCQNPSNLLKVLNNRKSHQYQVNFTVCVTPINVHFDKMFQFIEILELNRIFGAEHFVFYNHTVGTRVNNLLRKFVSDGFVTVIPWKIPVVVEGGYPEIHYFGQVAAINDCLYRTMLDSRFVVFSDLDEVIAPREHDTWSAMLDEATRNWQQEFFSWSSKSFFPGSYNIRNIFFRLDWEDMSTDDSFHFPLLSLQKLYREEMIYPWYVRSKYIVWSKMAVIAAIHAAFEFVDDSKVSTVRVLENHALLHHYRVWDREDNISSVKRVIDDRMLHFAFQLISRVSKIHRTIVF